MDVKLSEVGESFYNPYIPSNIAKLQVPYRHIVIHSSIRPVNDAMDTLTLTLTTCKHTPQSAGRVEEDEGMVP